MKRWMTALVIFFSAAVSAAPMNKFVVFGDSLSDNGNLYEYMKHQLPVSPPYFKGRFSNGPVWIEILAKSYYPTTSKEHLFDYAFGGAGVLEGDDVDDGLFTLDHEIESYLLANQDQADPNAMFVIWIGSNNYLAIPDDVEQSLHDVDLGIQHALEHLLEKGAKHFLVVNVPNLGQTPAARDFDAVEELTYLSKQHNATLEKNIHSFQTRYPDVQWLYYDVNVIFDDMVIDPERYGFTNVTDTCYEEAVDKVGSQRSLLKMVSRVNAKQYRSGDACKGYLFFDPVHPSGPAHKLMAEQTRVLLDKNDVAFE